MTNSVMICWWYQRHTVFDCIRSSEHKAWEVRSDNSAVFFRLHVHHYLFEINCHFECLCHWPWQKRRKRIHSYVGGEPHWYKIFHSQITMYIHAHAVKTITHEVMYSDLWHGQRVQHEGLQQLPRDRLRDLSMVKLWTKELFILCCLESHMTHISVNMLSCFKPK